MPDQPKPNPRAVQLLKRLRMMEQWGENASAHGESGTDALCKTLTNRHGDKADRLMAAQLLGKASTNLPAMQCLAGVAGNRGDDPQVRWAAMLALNTAGGPMAVSALSAVFLDPGSSKVVLRTREYGEKSLGLWALEFLYDIPAGRRFLEGVAAGRGYDPEVWSMALVMLFDDDPPRWSRALQDVVANAAEPLLLRKTALEALVYLLTESFFSARWDGRSAWDSVASVALARSDAPQLRSIAEAAMRKRPAR